MRPGIDDESENPESPFHKKSNRNGCPHAKAELWSWTQTYGHIRTMTYNVQQPMTQHSKKDNHSTPRIPSNQIHTYSEQNSP
jgi:hypothetical protein